MHEQQNTDQKVSGTYRVSKTFNQLSTVELYEVLKLRVNVFVVEQNCPYPECDDIDYEATHLMLYSQNHDLIGYARFYFLSEPNTVHIGRVAIAKSDRMNGLGRLLMDEVLTEIKQNKSTRKIEISAQLYLKKFYAGLGFECTGEPYKEDGIPHIKMLKQL